MNAIKNAINCVFFEKNGINNQTRARNWVNEVFQQASAAASDID